MDAEMEQQPKRPWWLAIVTIPNVLAIGGLLIGGAMTYQAQTQRVDIAESRIARAEERITALEGRLDRTVQDIGNIYMRRDNTELEMRAIREQIQLMRRDLR
jgi:chromosome segregation ATPase